MRLILILPLLAACSSQPSVELREVRVPIAVPCLEAREVPTRPEILGNPELQRLDDFQLVLAIASERLDLIAHTDILHAVLGACVSKHP